VKRSLFKAGLWLSLLLALAGSCAFAQTAPAEEVDARTDTAALGRDLGNADPAVRQRAAEALARLSATDQKKLIEGYYLQEKNKSVRLALEWASYRIGKEDALYRIIRDLDSSRHDQSVGYLAQLDTPATLYPFLHRTDNHPKMIVGLIEALGRIGVAETREQIQPFRDSFKDGVSAAAEKALDEIDARLNEPGVSRPGRPRTVSKP
jgi:HEAT repeat protein